MPDETNPLVSIVIINWNGKEITDVCLESIKENTKYPNYELIVVDNGSTDGSVEFIQERFPEVKIIENSQNLGTAKASNQGISAGSGQYFLVSDNDIEVEPGWLTKLVNLVEQSPDIGIVSPRFINPDGSIQDAGGYVTDAGIGRRITQDYKEPREVECTGVTYLIKKAVIDKIGMLDEGYFPTYFEQTDFSFRARRAGFKVYVNPQVNVIHKMNISQKEDSYKYLIKNKNRIRFMIINFPVSRLLKSCGWEILRLLKNIVYLRAHLLIKAHIINLMDLNDLMKKRRGSR